MRAIEVAVRRVSIAGLSSEGLPLGLEIDAAAVATAICSRWLSVLNNSSAACQVRVGLDNNNTIVQ
jgi:hypothetical protein